MLVASEQAIFAMAFLDVSNLASVRSESLFFFPQLTGHYVTFSISLCRFACPIGLCAQQLHMQSSCSYRIAYILLMQKGRVVGPVLTSLYLCSHSCFQVVSDIRGQEGRCSALTHLLS